MDEGGFPEADRVEGAPHPRETEHLFGQDRAARTFLSAMASGRLHHGWLITGPEGVGKATLAWRIARFVLAGRRALEPVDPASLYTPPDDPVFQKLAALGDPRLILIRRPYDPKTERLKTAITVDEVRKLSGFFHLSAADGGWRVAIIDAADEMNTSAANALLKILEEPPEKTLIFLISHQPGRLLPTIRSRCRTLACEPLNATDLGLALDASGFTMPPDMDALSQIAAGSAGRAIRLVHTEGDALYLEIVKTLGSLPRLDRGLVLGLADACVGNAAATRYDLTVELTLLALSRLAKWAVSGTALIPAAASEAEVFSRLSPDGLAGRTWADLVQVLGSKTAHARAVNLDPGSVILDMFLQIEATSARIT